MPQFSYSQTVNVKRVGIPFIFKTKAKICPFLGRFFQHERGCRPNATLHSRMAVVSFKCHMRLTALGWVLGVSPSLANMVSISGIQKCFQTAVMFCVCNGCPCAVWGDVACGPCLNVSSIADCSSTTRVFNRICQHSHIHIVLRHFDRPTFVADVFSVLGKLENKQWNGN